MTHPIQALYSRQLKDWNGGHELHKAWSGFFFNKLNFEASLKCHGGCVNCLQWSKAGRYLLSGSDDTNVCVWEPLQHRLVTKIPSHHEENIFSVKFVNRESQVVSGAGDGEVRHLDITSTSVLSAWRCHRYRVKRCCTIEDNDNIVISSSEDGTARQFDIREGHTCSSSDTGCANVLIKLENESIKSINSNPVRTHMICIGASDDVARIYDRRMLSPSHGTSPTTAPMSRYLPGHLLYTPEPEENRYTSTPSITWCTFDPTGYYLLCNMGGEQIYLYDIAGKTKVIQLSSPAPELHYEGTTPPVELDARTISLKDYGNTLYKQKLYDRAVGVYSQCIGRYPYCVLLCNNRAQALLKRSWKGDQYAALRDSILAVSIDPDNEKAHFRQIQSLHALDFNKLALDKLKQFEEKYPTNDKSLKTLSDEIQEAITKGQKDPVLNRPDLAGCIDYTQRYSGHCNCKTDIKEANFFGPDQEYIMAGSDDRHIFLWDRISERVLKVYRGDTTLVNCVQPHPTLPIIASSGLEKVVKLWSPQPAATTQHTEPTDDMADLHTVLDDPELIAKIAAENQSQMDNLNPFPNITMIQNAMLGMLDPDGNPNSCNTS